MFKSFINTCPHCKIFLTTKLYPTAKYMFKVNNRNTRTRCEICSKLTIKTTERRYLSLFFNKVAGLGLNLYFTTNSNNSLSIFFQTKTFKFHRPHTLLIQKQELLCVNISPLNDFLKKLKCLSFRVCRSCSDIRHH